MKKKERRRILIKAGEWIGQQYARHLMGLDSEWDQRTWIEGEGKTKQKALCNSQACFAGRIALDTGCFPNVEYSEEGHVYYLEDQWIVPDAIKAELDSEYPPDAESIALVVTGDTGHVDTPTFGELYIFSAERTFPELMEAITVLLEELD